MNINCMEDAAPRIHWLIALVPFAVLVTGIVMMVAQPHIMTQIGEDSGFRGLMLTYYGSTSINTGNEAITALVQTRGMKGMLSVVFLISPLMPITVAVIGYRIFRRTGEGKTVLS